MVKFFPNKIESDIIKTSKKMMFMKELNKYVHPCGCKLPGVKVVHVSDQTFLLPLGGGRCFSDLSCDARRRRNRANCESAIITAAYKSGVAQRRRDKVQ